MHSAGPYRLQRRLSTCEVGDVWSAADGAGRSVTVAVLNERASADDRWRAAFAAATAALAQAGADQLPIEGADQDTARPWVACAVERGPGAAQIFLALGRQLQPVDPPAAQAPASGRPVPEPPRNGAPRTPADAEPSDELPTVLFAGATAVSSDDVPLTRGPAPTAQPVQPPVAAGPWALPPATRRRAGPATADVSAPPADAGPADVAFAPALWTDDDDASGWSPPADPISSAPASGDHYLGAPVSGDPAYGRSRVFGDQPQPKPKRSLPLLIGVAVVALLLGAAAGVSLSAARGRHDPPAPAQSAAPTRAELLIPAEPPEAPGIEPPRGGGWPSSWPTFRSTESTRAMTGLAGVGFDFQVPPGWTCTPQAQAAAAARYRCGSGEGADQEGGELTVRTCAPPCGAAERTDLRRGEEAWGLQWIRSGPFTTWAETTEIDGQRRYGLVYVAYWRSVPEGRIDRQLVLRMTAPPATSDDLKKVANSIRESTFTL